ncbi:hypothetical protein ROZALSC1DRAFT_29278, partial [Rozella allomycis CSF55]
MLSKYFLEPCLEFLKTHKFRTIALQFPDDKLEDASEISETIENISKAQVYVLADTSYGNCCVDEVAASHVDADLIIHFGYSCLSKPAKSKKDLDCGNLKECVSALGGDKNYLIIFDPCFAYVQDSIMETFQDKSNIRVSRIPFYLDPEITVNPDGRVYKPIENDYSILYVGSKDLHQLSIMSIH